MRDPTQTDWVMLDCIIRLAVETGDVEAWNIAAERLAETANTPGPSSRPLLNELSPTDRIRKRILWANSAGRQTKSRYLRAEQLGEEALRILHVRHG